MAAQYIEPYSKEIVMKRGTRIVLGIGAALSLGLAAAAAGAHPEGHGPGAGMGGGMGMMGGGGMGMMGGGMGMMGNMMGGGGMGMMGGRQGMPGAYGASIEERLAREKSALGITSGQENAWQDYANARRNLYETLTPGQRAAADRVQ
jgi:hypothetical protein